MKHFRHAIYCLYQGDVLSEAAILYWSEKAMLPSGKAVFAKQMAPFIGNNYNIYIYIFFFFFKIIFLFIYCHNIIYNKIML